MNNLSVAEIKDQYFQKFQEPAPHKSTMFRILNKFKEKGTVHNQYKGRQVSVATPEKVNEIRSLIEVNPRFSIRKISSAANVPPTSTYNIIRNNLNLKPYKIQVVQELSDRAKLGRVIFSQLFLGYLNDHNILDDIWFSDEAHFYITGHVNKQNQRYWATSNPHELHETSLHPDKVTMWCALSSTGIVSVVVRGNVTSASYLELLENDFIPSLIGIGEEEFNNAWFMQDGARPHTANIVLDYLHQFFNEKVISNRFPGRHNKGFAWPAYSPDLNPCDFFLWGYLKERVFAGNPQNLDELEQAILQTILNIPTEMLQRVISAVPARLHDVIQHHGGHIEQYY